MEATKEKKILVKLIYTNKDPDFRIWVDKRQWILDAERRCYFPNLSLLLNCLAEDMFRKCARKIDDMKELEKAIDRVYDLIGVVSKNLIDRNIDNS